MLVVEEPVATAGRRGIMRRICSFPAMLAAALMVLAVLSVKGRLDDPDMWWHLKMGQIIWTTHHIPTTDIFSFTTGHHAYVPHEWLSQLLLYAAYRVGGYSGLMLWLCCLASALLITSYALCSLYSGNAKVAFLGAMVVWFFATVGLAVRPQLIGYLLLTVELLLLHLGQNRDARWFLTLPPLFALWVNCHGSFLLGLIVAATYLVSAFFDFQLGSLVAVRWDAHSRRVLTLALALSVAALFANPIGVKQVFYPLNTMLHQPAGLTLVQEWRPLQLTGARGIGWMAVLAGSALLVIIRRSELYWREMLMLVLGAWLAASHERMLFAFGILTAPIVSRLLAAEWEGYRPEQDLPWANGALIGASIIFALCIFPSPQNLAAQVERESPAKAVDYIKSHHFSGPMFNEYGYGGYLIWAAPEYPVFIDGRADVFEWTGVLAQYGQWASLQSDPRTLLDKYRINFCLMSRQSSMTVVMALLPEWKKVYSDDTSVIYLRIKPGSTNL